MGEIATALLEYSRRNGHITATVDLLALLQVTQQLLHLIQACRVLLDVIEDLLYLAALQVKAFLEVLHALIFKHLEFLELALQLFYLDHALLTSKLFNILKAIHFVTLELVVELLVGVQLAEELFSLLLAHLEVGLVAEDFSKLVQCEPQFLVILLSILHFKAREDVGQRLRLTLV